MKAAFLIPGFSPDLTFDNPSMDLLRDVMFTQGISLRGVKNSWGEHNVQDFGLLAIEQFRQYEHDGVLIGHSLGALAALKVIDIAPVQHLVLCSTSALFAEDIRENVNPAVAGRIGHARVQELSEFSAEDAVGVVNGLDIPTTVMFGENEHETNPYLVARCSQLATDIINAELIEVTGAGHTIGCDPYASELARVVSDIFSDLQ